MINICTEEVANEGYKWALQALCITPVYFHWFKGVVVEHYDDLVKVDTSKLPSLVASIVSKPKAENRQTATPKYNTMGSKLRRYIY